MDRWHAAITRILVAGSATGELGLREGAADAVAWQILGMIDGLNAHALVRWGETRAALTCFDQSWMRYSDLKPPKTLQKRLV